MARAFLARANASEFDTALCGPADRIHALGLSAAAQGPHHLVHWSAGRLDPAAELSWSKVSRQVGRATWYFPHWDMPWIARPSRSVILLSDVIPLRIRGATSRTRTAIARQWMRWTGKRATRIVVSTAHTRREVLEIWPDFDVKLSVIPLAVDRLFFSTPSMLPPEVSEWLQGAPYMVSVGNRKPHKNLTMGPEVLSRVSDIKWVIAGEPFKGANAIEDNARALGVRDRILVLSPQSDSVIHALYANAACLFFPSRSEGFGLPILEALASGTHVVSGDAGACVEVLGGHGSVCPVDDAESFAAAVRRVLTNGPPGAGGRAHAATFTWERSADLLATIIKDINH
jgi:glycosyltransferase involved in cell wall biosynthesis